MEGQRLLNWLQFAGTVGILGGLILVGIQISQSRELLRLQMEQEWSAGFQRLSENMLGESPADIIAKATDDPESLSTAELFILESYLNSYLDQWFQIKLQADLGLVPEDRWRIDRYWTTDDTYLTYVFGNHVSQAWWGVVSETGGWLEHQEFFEAVDTAIRRVDPNAMSDWQSRIRAKVAERIHSSESESERR